MSSRYSRPRRTKVYDANYYAAENAYKSALDSIDRKYGRSSVPPEPAVSNNGLSAVRASLERERPQLPRRSPILDEDDSIPRRKLNTSALLDEFDDIFESRKKTAVKSDRSTEASRSIKAITDEADEEFAASMKRIKASRAARAAAEDMEDIESNLSTKASKQVRSKLNFSSKVIDSVGLSDESISSGRKKILSIKSGPTDDGEDFTKWTAIKSGRRNIQDDDEFSGEAAAASRARQSRNRLQDLEAEMAELDERGAAREKRIKDLRRMLSENETNSKETLQSTVRVKSSIQSEKKVISSY